MAWTAPLTAVDGLEFTSFQYNTYIRDNMLEQAPAKATETGQYFVSEDYNKVGVRKAKTASITNSQTTTSTSYTDLSTVGPSVTVEHGERVMVFLAASMQNNTANLRSAASFSASGSTHVSAHDSWKIISDGVPANQESRYSMCRLVGKLNPGTSTFTMKYRVGGGTGTFDDRTIIVLPL